jgi:hypothetical protein
VKGVRRVLRGFIEWLGPRRRRAGTEAVVAALRRRYVFGAISRADLKARVRRHRGRLDI